MNINKMTKKEFESFPVRKWNEDIKFNSIVILPSRRLHDSGYRLMDFVAIRAGKVICRLSGCSDVIHVDGIGGFGYNWNEKYKGCPTLVPPSGWNIDCLPRSGLLHIWPRSNSMTVGDALSSFEIFHLPKNEEK